MKIVLVLFLLFISQVGTNIVSGQELKKAVLIKKKGDQLASEEVLLGYMPQCENGTMNEEMENRVKQLENEVLMLKRETSAKQSMENDRKATVNANNWFAVFVNSATGSELSRIQTLFFGIANSFLEMVFTAL